MNEPTTISLMIIIIYNFQTYIDEQKIYMYIYIFNE